ncbi:hypothetical protein BgAZ_100100 [Babesia gibsoni]|uniref:Uncharacterized protein n=1 Tax=Babesia gibsoni TaxID=33632 RepID=A0AAD8UV31_BABGI|nr:hypothetical protein BgAZ_100100 [Babesia gibsoni]
MTALKRLGEDVFVNIFHSASAGKSRIPLRRALSELAQLFYSNDASPSLSEEFMNEFYLRGVDIRCGLRSQVLMVGGPKNIRGNPRGGLDSRLVYPSITKEQFICIGRAMETASLERHVPQIASSRITTAGNTRDVQKAEYRKQQEQINKAKEAIYKD